MGARGTGCWGATCFVAARARKRRAADASMPWRGAVSHRQKASKSVINTTNSRFDPPTSDSAGGLGYSVSVFQCVVLACVTRATVGVGLQFASDATSGIDLPAWRVVKGWTKLQTNQPLTALR